MTGLTKRLHAVVRGMVQGVSFRYTTRAAARQLRLQGWVRNLPDGAVEVLAEGPYEQLKNFEAFLWQGPPAARVEDVHCEWSDPSGEFRTFEVTG